MCTTVTLPNGEWLQSVAELRAAGIAVTDDEQGDVDPGECLCGVDVEAILHRNDLPYKDEFAGGFFDLEVMPDA